MHGQLMGQSLLLDSVPHPCLSLSLCFCFCLRSRLCLPMTIGLIVSVSHHLPLCVNCVFGYRIVWSSNLPDKQPATSCVPDRVAGWLAVNFMVNYARRLRYLTFCATLIEALTIPHPHPHPSLPVSILSHVRFRLPPF